MEIPQHKPKLRLGRIAKERPQELQETGERSQNRQNQGLVLLQGNLPCGRANRGLPLDTSQYVSMDPLLPLCHCFKAYQDFRQSVEYWGYNATIIGEQHVWAGFRTKMSLVADFVHSLPDDDILAFADCYDAIVAGPPEELRRKILDRAPSLVVGVEVTCNTNCFKHGCPIPSERKFVNGGFLAGTVKVLKRYYDFVLASGESDDQIAMGMYASENCQDVYFDYD